MKPTAEDLAPVDVRVPSVRFERQSRLTSYAGLVLFQRLFLVLGLLARLRPCFAHLMPRRTFDRARVFVLLIVHLILGFRRLRGLDYYRDDPLVLRVVGLPKLPSMATMTRVLQDTDDVAVDGVRSVVRDLVLERLDAERLVRVTLDLDGSVQSTKGQAEGTAVGFNRKKKGARSYWPLYCTIAQLGSFLDVLHRPGNVNDSRGAQEFAIERVQELRQRLTRRPIIEARMDGAFFDQKLLGAFCDEDVSFTCSVPFERLAALKSVVESTTSWRRINDRWSSARTDYLPKAWAHLRGRVRFVLFRQRVHALRKQVVPGPEQLDLFRPTSAEFAYKVVVTNRLADGAAPLLRFHNGRGSQEKIFGEANQHAALDVIATRGLRGNQVFTLAAMLAHNLGRELQMRAAPRENRRLLKHNRPTLWKFFELGTLRQRLLHRAGRLDRPQGRDLLTMGENEATETAFNKYDAALRQAA